MKTKKKKSEFRFNELDKYRLDDEWVETDRQLGLLGEKLAEAQRDADYADLALEVRIAELTKKVRNDPVRYGITRTSNEAVEKAVILLLDKKQDRELQVEKIETKYRANIVRNAVNRLHTRGKAISDLIFLHSIGFFGPKTPKNMSKGDIDNMKMERIHRRTRDR